MPGPLNGLNIIEIAGLGPCPLAGQLLADLGAKVIVIDRSAGVDISTEVNRRNKSSIALNLKHEDGIKVARRLIRDADILLEGFRPGVMERLGLGPKDCLNNNPRLIYGRITGWGQDGPLSQTAGHDLNYFAITGFLHATGKPGEPPVPPLNFVADYGGGSMFLIMGVLAALFERGISGKGQIVDAAMIDGVPAMMGLIQSMLAQGLWSEERASNFIDGAAPYYRCYKCADGKFLSVGCIEPQFFAEFLRLAELNPDLSKIQNDKAHWPEMHRLFERTLASKSRNEWTKIFEGADVCVAPVLEFDEAQNHPHNKARGTFLGQAETWQTTPAPRFSRSNLPVPDPASTTGAESGNILTRAGYNEVEIAALESDGAVL